MTAFVGDLVVRDTDLLEEAFDMLLECSVVGVVGVAGVLLAAADAALGVLGAVSGRVTISGGSWRVSCKG